MLILKLELHSAITGKTTQIAQAIIANDGGAVQANVGHYDVKVARKGKFALPDNWHNPLRTGRVENYPRLSYNVWRLVIRALLSAFPEEQSVVK